MGEQLPPLNHEGDGGQAVNQYLRRRKVWMTLRDEAEHQGEQLTPYSFRHRYAKGMHAANVPISNICEAMGNTIEVTSRATPGSNPTQLLTSWQQSTSCFLGEASLIRQTRLAVKSEKIDT